MNIFSRITLRNLKKNRTRTLVTIIGIALSAAMFSAVTFTLSSLQHFLVEREIHVSGGWHAQGITDQYTAITELEEEREVSEVAYLQLLGFAELTGGQNAYKPYLCVQQMSDGFTDMMPVHLTEGRLPQNASEILLPEHLDSNGGITHTLNETLTLSLGDRMSGEERLDNLTAFTPVDEGGDKETLKNLHTVTYTVVGFYERPDFEDYSAPGYTALTVMPEDIETGASGSEGCYQVFFTLKNIKHTAEFMYKQQELPTWTIHYELLRLTASSGENNYNEVFYGLGGALVLIIMFGTISLIYNAFSISVSERTKQFGILTSVGATKKQLKKSVLTEACFLSAVGIPIGILIGLAGMGTTFYFLGDMLGGLLEEGAMHIGFHPSLPAFFIAVAISLLTILMSAYMPAVRASKKSAIDAIRQSQDIRIKARKLRTSPVTGKLFGFEGTIAAKNFKRNRKKYRATVCSLFVSIVLFISASSFGAYLEKSAGYAYADFDYNLGIYWYGKNAGNNMQNVEAEIRSLEDVKSIAYFEAVNSITIGVNRDSLNQQYLDNILEDYRYDYAYDYYDYWYSRTDDSVPEEVLVYANIFFLDDETFRNYLTELKLDEEEYFDPEHPKAVIWDEVSNYCPEKEKYEIYHVFDDIEKADLMLRPIRQYEGYAVRNIEVTEDGEYKYIYTTDAFVDAYNEVIADEKAAEACYREGLENGSALEFSIDEATAAVPLACDVVTEKKPAIEEFMDKTILSLCYPYSQLENVFRFYIEEANEKGITANSDAEDFYLYYDMPKLLPLSDQEPVFVVRCDNHDETAKELRNWISKNGDIGGFVNDYTAEMEQIKTVLLVLRVFAYGFIILISLIAVANVFNTIFTNVNLRRREFAMLKSVGLAPKGFRKMMIYECLLYGIKGLLYGLPVSVGVTWLIYHAVSEGIGMTFFIPWSSVAIAVGSVFLVVSISMIYAVATIRNKNTIDELKNENL